jgi:hypothetical protein
MKLRGTIAIWVESWHVCAIGQSKQANLPDSRRISGGLGARLPTAWGGKNSRLDHRLPRTFVLHTSIAHLYSAHLAFMRCHTNLTLIEDRAEIRPPICRIASGFGGLANRKDEQPWLK